MLETCARLHNVPMNRRHSRKSILNRAKHIFCTTVAFSKPSHLHITDLSVGSFPFTSQGREGCPHRYAWHRKSLCHFQMKGLVKWCTHTRGSHQAQLLPQIIHVIWEATSIQGLFQCFLLFADFLIAVKPIKTPGLFRKP